MATPAADDPQQPFLLIFCRGDDIFLYRMRPGVHGRIPAGKTDAVGVIAMVLDWTAAVG